MPVTYVDRIYYRENQYKRGYRGDELTWDIPNYFYFENISGSNNTLTLTRNNSDDQCPVVTLEYSTDGVNWQEWQAVNDVRTYTIPTNGKFYLRGNNTAFGQNANGYDYHQFSSNRNIEAHGNIMSLLDKTMQSTTITSTGCFRSLFRNMTTLKTAPELPATNLNNAAYIYTFQNTGITEAPELPATRVGNGYYYGMFYQCASLTKAAKMTINEFISGHVNACREMYSGCSNLTDISGITINATDINSYCFQSTFYNCTSLTKALPMTVNTVGASAFYQTYYGCSALTDASDMVINTTIIPSNALRQAFRECSSLVAAPTITSSPLTLNGDRALEQSFYGCSSLVVAPNLNISALDSAGIRHCYDLFRNCSALVDVSKVKLNAPDLYEQSYHSLFNGCTSLVTPPEINATTYYSTSSSTTTGSLVEMFYNCSSLKKIVVNFPTWDNYVARAWVSGVSSTGDFYNLGGATISRGNNGRPSGWTEHT